MLGYGLLDAYSMVQLGRLWKNLPPQHICSSLAQNVSMYGMPFLIYKNFKIETSWVERSATPKRTPSPNHNTFWKQILYCCHLNLSEACMNQEIFCEIDQNCKKWSNIITENLQRRFLSPNILRCAPFADSFLQFPDSNTIMYEFT